MKKLITALVLFGGAVAGAVACSGPASADVVVVNQSNSSTSTSTNCLPADVLAQLPPWLLLGSVPACP